MERLVAFVILALVAVVVLAGLGQPLYARFADRAEQIDDGHHRLNRLLKMAARRTEFAEEAARLEAQRDAFPSLLKAPRPALAVAAIQTRLKKAMQGTGAQLLSAKPLKPREQDGFLLVTLDASVRVTNNGMQKILRALEGDHPRLVIELLNIDAPRRRSNNARRGRVVQKELPLQVRMQLRGVVAVDQ